MGYGLGVDLGTSFTGAAVSRSGQARMVPLGEHSVLMPSIVRVGPDGDLIVGNRGRGPAAGLSDDPSRIGRDFKRRLGDPTPLVIGGQPHSAVALLAVTLRTVLEIVTALEGAPPEHVVLTCPAVWGPYRREQFAEVPRRAGLAESAVTLISEPEAAAHEYAAHRGLTEGDVIAVYDLGGGTFDTAVTRIDAARPTLLGLPEGLEWVGGVDFDEAVLAHLDRATGGALSALDPRDPAAATRLARARDECVRAKEALSRESSTVLTLPGPADRPGEPVEVPLTRGELEAMIRTPLESTLAAMHRTLASADVVPDDLAGVLLIGGSSRIPLVSQMLTADLSRPVVLDPHPQYCVALGAATLADPSTGPVLAPVVTAPLADGVMAERPPRRRFGRRFGRRHRLAGALLALATLIAAAVAVLVWPSGTSPHDVATPLAAGPSTTAVPTTSPPSPVPSTTAPSPSSTRKPSATPRASRTAAPTKTRRPRPTKTTPAPAAVPVHGTGVLVGLAGKCLDVANAVDAVGTPVQLFHCNNTGAQVWTAQIDGTLQAFGKCLDVTAGGSASPVALNTCTGAGSQTWQLLSGAIINPDSGYCLEVRGNSSADLTPVVTANCSDGAGQSWSLTTAG